MTAHTKKIENNSGWAAAVRKGQTVRIAAASRVAVVCFNAADLNERFDQARTKVYNMRLWVSAGEMLYSKLNNPLMTMVTDEFAGTGRHDLQFGMCGDCLASLATALRPWPIAPHHIPMPLNLFQHTEIDTATGRIEALAVRPSEPVRVDLRAEIDLVFALSAGPDPLAPSHAAPVEVTLLDPD